MKNLSFLRHLVFCCLMLLGTTLPASTWAVTINGDIDVCKGETTTYTPATPLNPNYSYTWTVTPSANGTVLSGNSTGANIQWNIVGSATINLTGRDPSLPGNPVVETGSLTVNVHDLPTPYITSNVMLACQPLNVDSTREQPGPPRFDDENCQLVCAFSTVVYTAIGTPGSTYTWNITGAVSFVPSGNTCTVTWGAPGNGQVKVTETTTFGCEASASFCVEIVESPVAKFNTVPPTTGTITICKDGEVVLQDQSTGTTASPIVSWHWDWGDGDVTTTSAGGALNPVTHQYTVPGTYEIKLTVTNSCGCSSTFVRRVRVITAPAPKIACPRVVCEGDRATYTVDIPCATTSWSVVGGTILAGATPSTAQIVWNNVDPNTGFGYVSYRSCSPCPQVVTEEVPVVLRRANIQGPIVICENEQYVYRLPKWPATEFDWFIVSGPGFLQPTDQRNEKALTATGPGTIVLGCKWRNTVLGCGGDATLTIQVLPKPVINGDDLFCQNETRSYNIGGFSGNWTLMTSTNTVVATGSGTSFTYNFTTPGTYKLGVTGTTFCPPEQFILKVVPTPAPPTIIDGPDSACAGIPIMYEAGAPVAGTTFQWSVSSGSVNAAVGDLSYITFAGLPPYTISVRRVTTDDAQCVSSPLNKVVVSPVPPLVVTGNDTVCHSTQETYALNYAGGDIYSWTISPSTLGSVVQGGASYQPTILWNIPPNPGLMATITATVTKCGLTYSQSYQVYVRGVPNISVTLATGQNDTVCSGTPVTFTVVPSYPITGATSTNWQWLDGPMVTSPGFTSGPPYNFTHTYNTDGTTAPVNYAPTVTIIDPNGCLGSVSGTAFPDVTVMPRPIALVSPTGPLFHCGTGWSETLNATVTTGIGGSNTFNWSPSGTGTSITTGAYGSYSVTVTNSVFGCSDVSNSVSIIQDCGPGGSCGPPPTVTLTPSSNCDVVNVAASVIGSWTAFNWSYPSEVTPGTLTPSNFSGTVDAAGLYTIGYTITYMSGPNVCQSTKYTNVLVPYLPDLRYDITCNQGGGNYQVTLYDHSTLYPPGSSITRNYYDASWTLIGSGPTATAFVAGGSTTIFHEIIQGGVNPPCTSTVSVVVPTFPVASFNLLPGIPNPGCVEDVSFNFNNTSTPTSPPGPLPLSCLWSFGDGSTNMIYNAGKVYAAPYSGPVTLTVTDSYGCNHSFSMNVTAMANPYAGNITAAPNPTCQGNPVTLTFGSTGISIPNTYTWYEQSNPLFTTAVNTYNVFAPGGYWVRVGDQYGCLEESDLIAVDIKQIPPISVIGDNEQCVNAPFTLTTQTIAGATYSWERVGSGIIGSGTSVTQTLGVMGSYTYRVTMTYNGCTRVSPDFIVTINPPPPPPSLSFNISCNPYQVQLTASGVAGTYNWNNGMSGTVINTPFGGPYQVTLTDLNGCQSDNSIWVPKDPAEYLWVFPTGCFCKLQIERPYVIGPIVTFSFWAWLKNGGVDVSGGGYMPNYFISPGNVYNMVLNNGWCSVTSGDMYFQSDTCNRLPMRPTDIAEFELTGDNIAMQLLPNPARDQVTVMYRFANSDGSRSIEMYDMIGRKLESQTVTNKEGNVVFSLDRVAAGMYQVVMRQDGKVVQQSKLSVTK